MIPLLSIFLVGFTLLMMVVHSAVALGGVLLDEVLYGKGGTDLLSPILLLELTYYLTAVWLTLILHPGLVATMTILVLMLAVHLTALAVHLRGKPYWLLRHEDSASGGTEPRTYVRVFDGLELLALLYVLMRVSPAAVS